jgi:hypothetical protein
VVAGYQGDLAQPTGPYAARTGPASRRALLHHPGLLGLEKRGIKAIVSDDYVALSGANLPRELFVSRIKDVVIVATKVELVKAAHDLKSRQYADSFFQSAVYFDHIEKAKRGPERKEFELFVNTKMLLDNLQFKGKWPDPSSQDFGPAFLGRLFQISAVKSIVGVAGIDEGAQVDLHGGSSELSPEQKTYRTKGFDQTSFASGGEHGAGRHVAVLLSARAHRRHAAHGASRVARAGARTSIETRPQPGHYQNLRRS